MNNQKKTFDLKLNEILEFIYKIYPFALIFFLLLDFATMTNIFNIEPGFFNTIFLSDNTISLSVVFIYMFVPLLIIALFTIGSSLSLYLSIYFRLFIKSFFKNQTTDSKKALLLASTLSIFIITFMYGFPLINKIFTTKFSFISVYGLFLMLLILSNSLILTLRLISKKIYLLKKIKINFVDFIISICILTLLFTNWFSPFKDYKFVVLIYLLFYIISILFYNILFQNPKKTNYITKFEKRIFHKFKIKNVFFLLFIFIYFVLFESANFDAWNKPIEVNNEKRAFKNTSINLIFNRGMLINNKNSIKFDIPSLFIELLNENEKKYFNEYLKNGKISYELSTKVQYLELGNNLKIYFQTIKSINITFIYLIEEKKFSNSDKSSFSLVELSSYELSK